MSEKLDYEILSFKSENNLWILDNAKGVYRINSVSKYFRLFDMSKYSVNEKVEITSVKRISDQLIVSVGDKRKEYGLVNELTVDKDGWGIQVHFNAGQYLLSGLDVYPIHCIV